MSCERRHQQRVPIRRLRSVLQLARAGHWSTLAVLGKKWLRSEEEAIGLVFDMSKPPALRVAPGRFVFRRLEPRDEEVFTRIGPDVTGEGALVRANADFLFKTGLRTPYVVESELGPVFMQYLVLPDENGRLDEIFGGRFEQLGPDEGLLEFMFVLEPARNTFVLSWGLMRMIDRARADGVAKLITYVPAERPSMLRFFRRAGFEPFCRTTERRTFFRRYVSFLPFEES